MVQARFLYGLHLARTGRTPEAAEEFREATRIMPALAEARLNLATALMRLGRNADALEQFETVLSQQPTNAAALQSVRALRAKSADAGANGPPAGPHMPLQP